MQFLYLNLVIAIYGKFIVRVKPSGIHNLCREIGRTHVYIYIYTYIYVHIYTYTCISLSLYIYIYIYMYRERERETLFFTWPPARADSSQFQRLI